MDETSVFGIKYEIAAKLGVHVDDISLMHPKENEPITEGKIIETYPEGIVYFEYGKIIAVDDDGDRRLEFVENQVKELSISEMRVLIADRLEVPRHMVELFSQNPTGDYNNVIFQNKQIKYSIKRD